MAVIGRGGAAALAAGGRPRVLPVPTISRLIVLVLALVALLGRAGIVGAAPPDDDLGAAALVPADATFFVEIDDAAMLRRSLGPRPVASFLARVLAEGEAAVAWRRLAVRTGAGQAELFDAWFGRACALAWRHGPDGSDWAVVTRVDRGRTGPMLARLEPRRVAPVHGLPAAELRASGLRLVRGGDVYVIGPLGSGRLSGEIAARLAHRLDGVAAAPGVAATSLAAHPAWRVNASDEPTIARGFYRHDVLSGGWSSVRAFAEGGRIRFAHTARFEHPPFWRPTTGLEWDLSTLDRLERAALIAIIEPTDIGLGTIGDFAEDQLGQPLFSRAMRQNLGDCQIFAIGEVEGRAEAPPVDLLVPTGAIAVEVKDAARAEAELDAHVAMIIECLGQPVPALPPAGQPRHVELTAVADRLEDHPVTRSLSLNWAVARGPLGAYYVIATHPAQLRETVRALEAGGAVAPRVGRWTSGGLVDGPRLGNHLRSYADQIARIGPVDPTEAEAFRQTCLMLSELATGVRRARWQMKRPTPHEMELELTLELREGSGHAEAAKAKR